MLPGDLAEELLPDEVDLLMGDAEALALAIDLETEAEAEDTVFLTAEVAAEALLLSLLPLNSFNSLDAAVLEVLVLCAGVGAVQLWSAGNRCEGQNCSLHCYNWVSLMQDSTTKRNPVLTVHLMGEKSTFLQFTLAQTGDDFAFVLPVITEHSVVKWASIRTLGS